MNRTLIKKVEPVLKEVFTLRSLGGRLGINSRTVQKWLEQGEADIDAGQDTLYAEFAREVRRVQADIKAELIKKVRECKSAAGWQQYMTLLERCFPEEFGRNQCAADVNVTGEITVKLDGDLKKWAK